MTFTREIATQTICEETVQEWHTVYLQPSEVRVFEPAVTEVPTTKLQVVVVTSHGCPKRRVDAMWKHLAPTTNPTAVLMKDVKITLASDNMMCVESKCRQKKKHLILFDDLCFPSMERHPAIIPEVNPETIPEPCVEEAVLRSKDAYTVPKDLSVCLPHSLLTQCVLFDELATLILDFTGRDIDYTSFSKAHKENKNGFCTQYNLDTPGKPNLLQYFEIYRKHYKVLRNLDHEYRCTRQSVSCHRVHRGNEIHRAVVDLKCKTSGAVNFNLLGMERTRLDVPYKGRYGWDNMKVKIMEVKHNSEGFAVRTDEGYWLSSKKMSLEHAEIWFM